LLKKELKENREHSLVQRAVKRGEIAAVQEWREKAPENDRDHNGT